MSQSSLTAIHRFNIYHPQAGPNSNSANFSNGLFARLERLQYAQNHPMPQTEDPAMVAADCSWDKPLDSLVECTSDGVIGYVVAVAIRDRDPPVPLHLVHVRISIFGVVSGHSVYISNAIALLV